MINDTPNQTGIAPLRGFTMIEVLVAIAIIGALAAMVIGGASMAKQRRTEARVRAQLQEYITAIGAYHAKFGQYPPDNVVSRTATATNVNPTINPLFYELTGMMVDNRTGLFRSPDSQETLSSAAVKQTFNLEGFLNASSDRKEIKNFLEKLKPDRFAIASKSPDIHVLKVPLDWPVSRDAGRPIPSSDVTIKVVNPWRYVSTNPTNNPGSFDLWAEFVQGKEVKIISNWNRDTFEKR